MDRLEHLAGVLGRERRLLEFLLFKMVAARHILAAGETRFLGWSSAEVERAAERVRDADEQRARAVEQLVAQLDLATSQPTLRELAQRSPAPFGAILDDHHVALHGLMNEISTVAATSRELAEGGMQLVTDVVELIEAGIG